MWPKIIQVLKERGFSQKAIADRAGVDQSTICRLAIGSSPEPRFAAGQAMIEMLGGPAELERLGIKEKNAIPSVERSFSATNAVAQGAPQ